MRIMVLVLMAWLAGCATSEPVKGNAEYVTEAPIAQAINSTHEEADDSEICLKSKSFMVEMCYERGAARVEPDSGRVIGYEMQLTRIDTNAR